MKGLMRYTFSTITSYTRWSLGLKITVSYRVNTMQYHKEVLCLEHEWRGGPLLQLWFIDKQNINSRIIIVLMCITNPISTRIHYNILDFTRWTFSTKTWNFCVIHTLLLKSQTCRIYNLYQDSFQHQSAKETQYIWQLHIFNDLHE